MSAAEQELRRPQQVTSHSLLPRLTASPAAPSGSPAVLHAALTGSFPTVRSGWGPLLGLARDSEPEER
jgi:hypothetical protein